MARNTCYGYDFNTGACVSYGDDLLYPGAFYGVYAGGGVGPAGGNSGGGGQIGANPANPNAPAAPVAGFPPAVGSNTSIFPGSGQAQAGNGGADVFWWVLIGGIALWALSK